MPTTTPILDIVGERQSGQDLRSIRTLNDNGNRRRPLMNLAAVADIVKSTLGPRRIWMNPQTEPANLNADDLDDNADLIDENGALAVTLEDGGDALDCGVCYLPLRPPIFQCENGHVLCSPCRRKLESTGNGTCHVCRVDLDDEDESKCHAMERVVESIRVACPNAVHGCGARLTYYDRSSHRRVCPHARYSCSGHGCGFVGSLGALLDHVASVHTNNDEFMQQFLAEELSRLMAKLKLRMAIADIRVAGVDPLDIELVMSEAAVSVDKAAKALKESEGDVITAIRKLTN